MLGLDNSLSPTKNILDYVARFRERVQEACVGAKEALAAA